MTNNYNNHSEEENFSFDKNKKNPFSMPDDYFNSFADKMKIKLELEEELEEFSVLSSISKVNSFAVPQNYFANAEVKLEQSLELQSYAALNAIKKPELKTVAEEYFELNKQNVINAIEIAEELKQYSTLYSLDKQNTFAMPVDYFDTVADNVKEKFFAASQVQVNIFVQILNAIFKPRMILAYASAIVIAVGVYFFINQKTEVLPSGECYTIACIEKQDILDKQNIDLLDDETLYEIAGEENLDQMIDGETIDNGATDNDASM